jgi:hypothetical protein
MSMDEQGQGGEARSITSKRHSTSFFSAVHLASFHPETATP